MKFEDIRVNDVLLYKEDRLWVENKGENSITLKLIDYRNHPVCMEKKEFQGILDAFDITVVKEI